MFRNVVSSLKESLDITAHLKPLVSHFKALETAEFSELPPLFAPLMHSVCLIYSNSDYYNSPARIITLMREICNQLIALARKHIDPESVFQIEVRVIRG